VLPELNDYLSGRSEIYLFLKDAKNMVLRIKAEDPVSLRSAINTWFRLIQIAQEIHEITAEIQ
jgi:KEOPS complex subunit Pcc1